MLARNAGGHGCPHVENSARQKLAQNSAGGLWRVTRNSARHVLTRNLARQKLARNSARHMLARVVAWQKARLAVLGLR